MGFKEVFAEDLARFKLGPGFCRAEYAPPFLLKQVDDAAGKRVFRSNDGQVYPFVFYEVEKGFEVMLISIDALRDLRNAGIARAAIDLVDRPALGKLPADRMFATAATDYQYFHKYYPRAF
jgi:hypothetical protein